MNSELSKLSKVRFIGYGLQKGRALGTLSLVDEKKIIEMPVAENLMVGFGIGRSLKGYFPIVFIERMDFILNALDAIVNHLDKIKEKSGTQFSPGLIIRCVFGNRTKPLYTGITHTKDYSEAISKMISFPVIKILKVEDVEISYKIAIENLKCGKPTILVEYKDLI